MTKAMMRATEWTMRAPGCTFAVRAAEFSTGQQNMILTIVGREDYRSHGRGSRKNNSADSRRKRESTSAI